MKNFVQMKKEHFFPLEVNIMNDERIARLIQEHGIKGFGAYMVMLLELRQHQGYRCGPHAVLSLARAHKMNKKTFLGIVEGYDLFHVEDAENQRWYSSPYLNRVMKEYEDKIARQACGGRKNADSATRDELGRFTIGDGTKEKNRKEKKIKENSIFSNTVVLEGDTVESFQKNNYPAKPLSWEYYLQQAIEDESWMKLLGTKSEMEEVFATYNSEIIEAFRCHIRLQGTEHTIHSIRDMKSYFANYLRPGTPTQRQLLELLKRKEKLKEVNTPTDYSARF